jgi:hypothetical protein
MRRPIKRISNSTKIGTVVGQVNSGSGDLAVTISSMPKPSLAGTPFSSPDTPSTRDRRMVFISYSHLDVEWLKRLQIALKPLVRSEKIVLWDDTHIEAGNKWHDDIRRALDAAGAAVFLVTQNFLASDFIAENEMPPLLKASEERGLRIFWIAAGASLYRESPLFSYQCMNDPDHPLDTLSRARRSVELVRVAEKIRDTLNS